jgi:hypothetical protein
LLFNWIGYRLVSGIMQQKASNALEARLDKNDYDDSQLFEMRVSLNLPYQNDWSDFERFNGEIEIDGIQYKYVKRKIEKGQLVVMCIPNHDKMKIRSSSDEYFKMVNDLQQSEQGKKSEKSNSFAFKGLFNEYQSESNNWSFSAPPITADLFSHRENHLVSSLHNFIPSQPPELS